ncbi:Ras-related protein Rab-34 [Holothuria leucospilota]|uniref:Ras-related protein Rab-36 n=1 Tax=Holothuria leucospilota TaxID=206669 RepID=A0A9Q1HBU9_HOLLE|nr:Ras-related protein Rab-34 [Holothuria leucospilota]
MSSSKGVNDRSISLFPEPYRPDATPYKVKDFHASVRNLASSNKTGSIGLQMSKCIVVGDVAVGKTCLVNRFCNEVFDKDYKATIGVDFEVERFEILNTPFNLQIWDTAGQERFKCIAAAYYRGAHVVIIVFDLTDKFTLEHAEVWHAEAVKEMKEAAFLFLVGTKKDICEEREFKEMEEKAVKLAKKLDAEFWAVSSLTNENVEHFFCRVASMAFNDVMKKSQEDETDGKATKKVIAADSSLISLKPETGAKDDEKKSCCSS